MPPSNQAEDVESRLSSGVPGLDVVLSGEQGSISRHRVTQHPFIGIYIVWDRCSASRNFRGNTHRLIARNRAADGLQDLAFWRRIYNLPTLTGVR